MTNIMGLPHDLERHIMKLKLDEETKNYQAFIEDIEVQFNGYSVVDDYDAQDYNKGYSVHQVKLTYKPKQTSVMLTYNSSVYDYGRKPSKNMIVDELKRHAKLATIGEWERRVDRTGVWYCNYVLGKGDVSIGDLTMWNEHTSLLKTLLGTRFDRFITT
jgi:hypothetical protein